VAALIGCDKGGSAAGKCLCVVDFIKGHSNWSPGSSTFPWWDRYPGAGCGKNA